MSRMLLHLPQNTTTRSLSPTSLAFRPYSSSLTCPISAHSGLEYETLRNPRRSPTDRARPARIDELGISREESYDRESINGSDSGITEQNKVLVRRQSILRSWIKEQLWSDPRTWPYLNYSESQCLAALRLWIAAWYTKWCGCYRKRFLNDHLPKKDCPPPSSTIQRIWHPPLREWDLILPEQQGKARVKWNENRWIRQFLHLTSKEGLECWIILVELILTMVWWIKREFLFEMEPWKISWLWISKLESQLQHWGLSKISGSSDHYALDQRSWECHINWWTYDIAVDCGARFPGFRYAWCDDCVCIETASQHADTFPKENKCRRAACSKTRPILTRKTTCVHDPRVFPCNRSLWSSTRTLNFVRYKFTEWRRPRFRHQMGSCTIASEWNAFKYDPGRIVQVKITEFCSTSDCVGVVWSRNGAKQGAEPFSLEDSCKTSYWSDGENSKLHGPERRRVKKERKPALKGKWESVFSGRHMDSFPEETHVVSVMTHKPLETMAKVRDKKDDRLLLHPIRRQNRLTARGKNRHRDQAGNRKAHWTRVKFHADTNSVKIRHVNHGISRVCDLQVWKKGCVHGDKCHFRHVEAGKPSKKSNKGGAKDQLRYWRRLYHWVVYLKILIRESPFYVKKRDWDRSTPSNSPMAPGTKVKFGKERVHREELSKS